MDSERAERHLRLAAEAELRRVRAQPRPDAGAGSTVPLMVQAIGRLGRISRALVAVGAIDGERVESLGHEFRTALGVRGLDPPGLRTHVGWARSRPLGGLAQRAAHVTRGPAGPSLAGTTAAAAAAAVLGPAAASPVAAAGQPVMRTVPVARMFPFHREEANGEVYVLSLVTTANQAALSAIVRIRQAPAGPVLTAARARVLPFQVMSAADDAGRPYNLVFAGGGHANAWVGHFSVHPVPPADARWLQLADDSGEPAIRIDLCARSQPPEVRAEPAPATPGERLLNAVAQSIIVGAAHGHVLRAQLTDGLGDLVAALEAAGALSVFSPAPARLAALCQRLGIDTHGIPVPPAADLPRPWTDVLAYYGRRHRPPGRDGIAALSVLLPELDGARFALAGLESRDDQTTLYVVASGLAADRPAVHTPPSMDLGSAWWLRDDAGHWHVAAVDEWTASEAGESRFGLRVYPPLGRAVTSVELVISGATTRLRTRLPVSWWAGP